MSFTTPKNISVQRRHRFPCVQMVVHASTFPPSSIYALHAYERRIIPFGMKSIIRLQRLQYARIITPHSRKLYRAPALPHQCRKLHVFTAMMSPAKRKAEQSVSPPKTKKPRIIVPEYHLTPSRQDECGENVWPARAKQIDRAREIIKEWFVSLDLITMATDLHIAVLDLGNKHWYFLTRMLMVSLPAVSYITL